MEVYDMNNSEVFQFNWIVEVCYSSKLTRYVEYNSPAVPHISLSFGNYDSVWCVYIYSTVKLTVSCSTVLYYILSVA